MAISLWNSGLISIPATRLVLTTAKAGSTCLAVPRAKVPTVALPSISDSQVRQSTTSATAKTLNIINGAYRGGDARRSSVEGLHQWEYVMDGKYATGDGTWSICRDGQPMSGIRFCGCLCRNSYQVTTVQLETFPTSSRSLAKPIQLRLKSIRQDNAIEHRVTIGH